MLEGLFLLRGIDERLGEGWFAFRVGGTTRGRAKEIIRWANEFVCGCAFRYDDGNDSARVVLWISTQWFVRFSYNAVFTQKFLRRPFYTEIYEQ